MTHQDKSWSYTGISSTSWGPCSPISNRENGRSWSLQRSWRRWRLSANLQELISLSEVESPMLGGDLWLGSSKGPYDLRFWYFMLVQPRRLTGYKRYVRTPFFSLKITPGSSISNPEVVWSGQDKKILSRFTISLLR